jgi:hypothetical protein
MQQVDVRNFYGHNLAPNASEIQYYLLLVSGAFASSGSRLLIPSDGIYHYCYFNSGNELLFTKKNNVLIIKQPV